MPDKNSDNIIRFPSPDESLFPEGTDLRAVANVISRTFSQEFMQFERRKMKDLAYLFGALMERIARRWIVGEAARDYLAGLFCARMLLSFQARGSKGRLVLPFSKGTRSDPAPVVGTYVESLRHRSEQTIQDVHRALVAEEIDGDPQYAQTVGLVLDSLENQNFAQGKRMNRDMFLYGVAAGTNLYRFAVENGMMGNE